VERVDIGGSQKEQYFRKAKAKNSGRLSKLNDLTIGDSYPLLNITDILDQLGNAKYF